MAVLNTLTKVVKCLVQGLANCVPKRVGKSAASKQFSILNEMRPSKEKNKGLRPCNFSPSNKIIFKSIFFSVK